jgi:hypothetical protein
MVVWYVGAMRAAQAESIMLETMVLIIANYLGCSDVVSSLRTVLEVATFDAHVCCFVEEQRDMRRHNNEPCSTGDSVGYQLLTHEAL